MVTISESTLEYDVADIHRAPNVTVSMSSPLFMRKLLKKASHLHTLIINITKPWTADFERTFRTFKHRTLRNLVVNGDIRYSIVLKCRKLEYFELNGRVQSVGIRPRIGRHCNLQHYIVRSNLDPISPSMFRNCPNLEEINCFWGTALSTSTSIQQFRDLLVKERKSYCPRLTMVRQEGQLQVDAMECLRVRALAVRRPEGDDEIFEDRDMHRRDGRSGRKHERATREHGRRCIVM